VKGWYYVRRLDEAQNYSYWTDRGCWADDPLAAWVVESRITADDLFVQAMQSLRFADLVQICTVGSGALR
jgi:hypothetical protein